MTEAELKELDEAYAQVGIIPVNETHFVYRELGRHEFIFEHKGEKYKLKLSKVKQNERITSGKRRKTS